MPAESKSLSEFPRALQVLSGALLLISNPSGQDSFDTNSALLTEVAQAMLDVHYTQELGDVSVFDAIKNCRVLSGTTTPTSALGVDGQLYIKYETTGGVDEVVAMYFKKSSAWLEISLGGGNTDYIECTQAQYDAWEQGGTLDPDTLYFITDGNIGNDIIDDSTASETTVYSSDKVEDLLSDKQYKSDNSLATTSKTVVGAINELKSSLTYNAGDSIGISNAQLAGILTTGQKQIIIQIPVLKPISASTATLNPDSLWSIRHVSGGYIISNAKLSTIGTYSLAKNGLGLVLTIDLTNAFTGAPNNTPIVGSLAVDNNNIITFS